VHTKIEELLEAVFSMQSVTRLHRKSTASYELESRVKAGSNISTVALRVVGGDEKGTLESETVKYGRESHGTSSNCKRQIHPLVRESALHQQTSNYLIEIKIWL
jgi:hypothetical protein